MEEELLVKNSIFKIGKVVSVEGRTVSIAVDKAKNSTHIVYKNSLVKNVSVGSYLKICKGFTNIICKVEGEYTSEDPKYSLKYYTNEKNKISRALKVSLLGFFEGSEFKRGIKEMPLVDNECFLLDGEEFNAVHKFTKKTDTPLPIGSLSLEKAQEIEVGIDSLFASHIGIFGNTGSGKSYTLAKIYHELFKIFKDKPYFKKHAKFFLVDFNGEYVDDKNDIIVESEYKSVYRLSTREPISKYPINAKILMDDSLWRILLDATPKTQAPFIRRALTNTRVSESMDDPIKIKNLIKQIVSHIIEKGEKELGYSALTDFFLELRRNFKNSNFNNVQTSLRSAIGYHDQKRQFYIINEPNNALKFELKEIQKKASEILDTINISLTSDNNIFRRLKRQIIFLYFIEIVNGYENQQHLGPLIKRLDKRFDDFEKVVEAVTTDQYVGILKNFTIVSLKDVNIEMKKILPLLFCKTLYDDQKDNPIEGSYLNLIIDEAHNILSAYSERENEDVRDYRLETFEEIIKEGRKFGVFMTIASHRPADISPTIISQLHNFFLHRLINNRDIEAVEKTISYLDKISFEYLPILPTGSCVLAGLSAQVPIIIDVKEIDSRYEPNNKTRQLVKFWIS